MNKEAVIEEYKVLRAEILMRARLLHQLPALGSIFWVIFLLFGSWIYLVDQSTFTTYLLIIPLVFAGLIFNYQDNQRTLEVTAKYIEEVIKPKLDNSFEWEQWFAGQKKLYQFSSAYKIFALIIPFVLPIIVLRTEVLSSLQLALAIVDLLILVGVLINFRYKLYRIK